MNLTAGVAAGIAEADFQRAAGGSGILHHPPAEAAAPLPLYRRAVRRALRLLRPLALPFLTRLQGRVAAGVDGSETALRSVMAVEQLNALQLATTTITERLAGSEARVAERLAGIEARVAATDMSERLAGSEARVTERLAGIEARVAATDGLLQYLLRRRAIALGDEVLARTPHGWLLLPAEDVRLVAAMVESGGQLEPGTAAVVQALLEPGDLAVDAGAHCGTLTLAMARAVGMNGRVVAIEPTPRLSALLCRNAWMNSLEGVITVEACALGAERGSGLLSIEPTLGHNSLLPSAEATNSISVPIRGLDDVLPPGAFPALVKLDVEGFELEVWRGMARTIAAAPDLAVIVEFGPSHLARAGIAIADWIGTFLASGFTPWEIAEDSATIRPLRTDGLDRVFSMNILLLRADPARWPRLVRA